MISNKSRAHLITRLLTHAIERCNLRKDTSEKGESRGVMGPQANAFISLIYTQPVPKPTLLTIVPKSTIMGM